MAWRDRVGSTIGVLFVAGLFFMQCVYPFLRDESVAFTCADPEFAANCDEDGSLANFFVEVCGRDQLRVEVNVIRSIGGEPGVREPADVTMAVYCGDHRYIRFEAPEGTQIDEFEDLRQWAIGASSRQVLDIYERWVRFEISADEARQRLLSVE
jgi:hypothetical protein